MFESIAIVGATGAVGTLIRNMLEEREFPYSRITFLASPADRGAPTRSEGSSPPPPNRGCCRTTSCIR